MTKTLAMDKLEMAGHLVRRLHQQSTLVFQTRTQAAGLDLTAVQFAALDGVADQPGIDQASLAAAIGYDRATIGGVVDRLEAKGLVSRVVSPQDRRARLLHLSAAGQQLLARCRPLVQDLQAEILGPLSAAERAAFVALARKALGLPDGEGFSKPVGGQARDTAPAVPVADNPACDSPPRCL